MLFRALLYSLAMVVAVFGFSRLRSARARQFLLLVLSYALYVSWAWWFGLVLLASTLVNFLFGQRLRRKRSALTLWTGIAVNVALLSSFKYLPEFAHSFSLPALQTFSRVVLPLGISFWTFQAMSYLFDLYRGEELDPSFVEFALYMAFFPVTISGPICRMTEMLPQFRSEQAPARDDIGRGLCRIATGVLMMQIAQLLGKGILGGEGINGGFDPSDPLERPRCLVSGIRIWFAALLRFRRLLACRHRRRARFWASPCRRTLPGHLPPPRRSIFWTRWHMSLSFWIRDYVFLPLAMLRREVWWRNLALVISMVLFGLWHKGKHFVCVLGKLSRDAFSPASASAEPCSAA